VDVDVSGTPSNVFDGLIPEIDMTVPEQVWWHTVERGARRERAQRGEGRER
jgi:hypothetical protein